MTGILLLCSAMLIACGGDDGTGPGEEEQEVNFPALSANVMTQFCVRGTATPVMNVNGAVADDDCPAVFPIGVGLGFYEAWRVRVGRTRAVTLETSSNFDSYIDVFRLDNLAAPVLDFSTLIDFDDDSGTGVDALLTVTLQPGVEYWVVVSGFDATDVGPYTLEVRGN